VSALIAVVLLGCASPGSDAAPLAALTLEADEVPTEAPPEPAPMPPLKVCVPEGAPAEIVEAIDDAVELIETQAGLVAFNVVDGGVCDGGGEVAITVEEAPDFGEGHEDKVAHTWCDLQDGLRRCGVTLPAKLPAYADCAAIVVGHELAHIVLGDAEHTPGTLTAEKCNNGRRYLSWEQLVRIRHYFGKPAVEGGAA
jgi:hypothetical protein